MKLSEMRQVLETRKIQLTKSLGQNFLHDANQIRRIIEMAELAPTDRVLEIGPGLGPLTRELVARAGEVLALEKDGRLVDVLRERFGNEPRLRLRHVDALAYLERQAADWSEWKLVSNLPYCVASSLLIELSEVAGCPERLVTTLQLEVLRRLVAGPGTRDYGTLTLLVQLRYLPGGSFRIPSDCFFPAPDVESGAICLRRRPEELLSAAERGVYRRVVKRAFSERRKKALKLLRFDWPAAVLGQAWSELGLSELARAETINLEQFVHLARRLAAVAPPPVSSPSHE